MASSTAFRVALYRLPYSCTAKTSLEVLFREEIAAPESIMSISDESMMSLTSIGSNGSAGWFNTAAIWAGVFLVDLGVFGGPAAGVRGGLALVEAAPSEALGWDTGSGVIGRLRFKPLGVEGPAVASVAETDVGSGDFRIASTDAEVSMGYSDIVPAPSLGYRTGLLEVLTPRSSGPGDRETPGFRGANGLTTSLAVESAVIWVVAGRVGYTLGGGVRSKPIVEQASGRDDVLD